VLSLAPTEAIVRTDLGGRAEHVIAYTGAVFVTGLAYWNQGAIRLAVAFATYAGILETLQRFSPGRTSSLVDYMFSIAGIVVGMVLVLLLKKWMTTELSEANSLASTPQI
jgi:VanZ family protein